MGFPLSYASALLQTSFRPSQGGKNGKSAAAKSLPIHAWRVMVVHNLTPRRRVAPSGPSGPFPLVRFCERGKTFSLLSLFLSRWCLQQDEEMNRK